MRVTLKLPEGERKRQDKSVRHAENRRCRARMLRVHGPIRPVPATCATADAVRREKRLSSGQNQAILTSYGGLLGECRSKCLLRKKYPMLHCSTLTYLSNIRGVAHMTFDQNLTRRVFIGGAVAALATPQAQAQCAPIDLGIQNTLQVMSNWCWVAAAQQVIYWATGNAPQQCELVSLVAQSSPQITCTQPQAFNHPASFQPIAFLIQQFIGAHSSMSGPGSPQQVYQTISARRPVIMLVYPGFSQVGHFVVVRGVSCLGPELVFHLNDPLNFSGFPRYVPYSQIAQMWHSALVVG